MEVTVYSTRSCPYCELEKDYLRERGIPFREVQVDQDQDGLEEMIRLSGQLGVPFTVVKRGDQEDALLGFDPEALGELIGVAA
jgi:glutaredoxin 3